MADLLISADVDTELQAACLRMTEIGKLVRERACAAGSVDPDLRGTDVAVLMNAAAWARSAVSTAASERMIAFTLAGFRHRAVDRSTDR